MLTEATADCLGKRRLVVGEVNTGKTTLCNRWLSELCRRGFGTRIALIDMAPTIPDKLATQRGVAVRWRGASPAVRLRSARSASTSRTSSPQFEYEDEAMKKALHNAQVIHVLISQLQPGRDILFINDVTLYLQTRSAEGLITAAGFDQKTTLVVNGYQGERWGAEN